MAFSESEKQGFYWKGTIMINLKLQGSVGTKGRNHAQDVKLIAALINVYRRSLQQPSVIVRAEMSSELETAIGEFQRENMGVAQPDQRVDVGGATFSALRTVYRNVFQSMPIFPPTVGEVTWYSEGMEGGPYHSRCFSVPSTSSGLTLGRGYDLKEKTPHKIANDLISAGVNPLDADLIQQAAGLKGAAASFFVIENDLLDFQVTPEQQLVLFHISYQEQANEVKRICDLAKNVQEYGRVHWESLHEAIKAITIDLKFRGDYIESTRRNIQFFIAQNDLSAFKKHLTDRAKWSFVPKDRFERRAAFLEQY